MTLRQGLFSRVRAGHPEELTGGAGTSASLAGFACMTHEETSMIIRLALCTAAGCAMLSAGPASQAPVASEAPFARAQVLEWSAAKKKRHAVRHATRPSYAYRAPRYGRPLDPAFGPNGLPYRRPYDLGGCIIDEGYGRFSACPNE
jgi:hypothetical protein